MPVKGVIVMLCYIDIGTIVTIYAILCYIVSRCVGSIVVILLSA